MTELLQVSCRSHHHIGYQHSTFHLPRSIKHYKMRGRAEHSVVEIHICERNHIVAKAWRNSGHNNKNNRDFFCSHVFRKATFSFVGNPRAPNVWTWARKSVNWWRLFSFFFKKVPNTVSIDKLLIIFSVLLNMCNTCYPSLCESSNSSYIVYHFVSEWKRRVVIEQTEQTRFLRPGSDAELFLSRT